jgi:hypothetical protein
VSSLGVDELGVEFDISGRCENALSTGAPVQPDVMAGCQ